MDDGRRVHTKAGFTTAESEAKDVLVELWLEKIGVLRVSRFVSSYPVPLVLDGICCRTEPKEALLFETAAGFSRAEKLKS